MESYLHIGLIVSLVAVLFFLIFPLKPKRPLLNMDHPSDEAGDADPFPHDHRNEQFHVSESMDVRPSLMGSLGAHSPIISIAVFAKPNSRFASYDLLQSITATGMEFGDMNIFHYFQRSPTGQRITLFNLASATKPGEFDLNRMGNFSCVGLSLFMDMTAVPNPLQAYYLMVSTAEQLAEDLHGDLRFDPRTPWTEDHFQYYQQSILQLEPLPSV